MSTPGVSLPSPLPPTPSSRAQRKSPAWGSVPAVRILFWSLGLVLAAIQAWGSRYYLTADSVSYLDMSDAVLPGFGWHRLINGVWSPLYPILLGVFRRSFSISPRNEVVAAHLLNVGIFVFAFLGFEFLLKSLVRLVEADGNDSQQPAFFTLPGWVYTSIAYALFLWASLSAITLESLRPDMLMSGFVYLVAGILLRMQGEPARWRKYLVLGVVLGVAFLAKAPMLPIGVLVLASSLLLVKDWKPAVPLAAASLAITLLIGSLYFVPLSLSRGHFTLGESGGYNYLVHVDRARPDWYLQDPVHGAGSFTHPPQEIFSSPPTYAFALPYVVTHPLRFDPTDWTAGVRPRFALKRQIGEFFSNLSDLGLIAKPLWLVAAVLLLLGFFSRRKNPSTVAFVKTWPLWVIGMAGCAMYLAVHVEDRYVGVFLLLIGCGAFFSFRGTARTFPARTLLAGTVVLVVSLLLPTTAQIRSRYSQIGHGPNEDAQAAFELQKLGIQPGDHVARISRWVTDLGVERIARVEVVSEVDFAHAREFWSASTSTQQEILRLFGAQGARAVIATSPPLDGVSQSEWQRLGSTRYWAWLPAGGKPRPVH